MLSLTKFQKRQKKLVEEKNKTSKNVANRKPTVRAKRTSVMTRSYREVSDSELETDEPAPAKAGFCHISIKSLNSSSLCVCYSVTC